jgi:hypothetical protein
VPEGYQQFVTEDAVDDYKIFLKELDKYWKTDIKSFMPEWGPYL